MNTGTLEIPRLVAEIDTRLKSLHQGQSPKRAPIDADSSGLSQPRLLERSVLRALRSRWTQGVLAIFGTGTAAALVSACTQTQPPAEVRPTETATPQTCDRVAFAKEQGVPTPVSIGGGENRKLIKPDGTITDEITMINKINHKLDNCQPLTEGEKSDLLAFQARHEVKQTAPTPEPGVIKEPLIYKLEEKERFGGFSVDITTDDGRKVGFTDKEKGPRDLFNQILLMLVYQSKGVYGTTPAQLETYLKRNSWKFPGFVYPVLDEQTINPGSRTPPYVAPSQKVTLDLSKPMIIQRAEFPPIQDNGVMADRFRLSDSRFWSSITVVNGQLIFTESFGYPFVPELAASVSIRLYDLFEATARINEAKLYKQPDGTPFPRGEDFMSVIRQKSGRNYVRSETVIDREVFVVNNPEWTKNSYALLGVSQ